MIVEIFLFSLSIKIYLLCLVPSNTPLSNGQERFPNTSEELTERSRPQ